MTNKQPTNSILIIFMWIHETNMHSRGAEGAHCVSFNESNPIQSLKTFQMFLRNEIIFSQIVYCILLNFNNFLEFEGRAKFNRSVNNLCQWTYFSSLYNVCDTTWITSIFKSLHIFIIFWSRSLPNGSGSSSKVRQVVPKQYQNNVSRFQNRLKRFLYFVELTPFLEQFR